MPQVRSKQLVRRGSAGPFLGHRVHGSCADWAAEVVQASDDYGLDRGVAIETSRTLALCHVLADIRNPPPRSSRIRAHPDNYCRAHEFIRNCDLVPEAHEDVRMLIPDADVANLAVDVLGQCAPDMAYREAIGRNQLRRLILQDIFGHSGSQKGALGTAPFSRRHSHWPQRPHKWKNDELEQFWDVHVADRFCFFDCDVAPLDAMASLLLIAAGFEASHENWKAVLRRLTSLQRQCTAWIAASELDHCGPELRRSGGLRAWVGSLVLLPGETPDYNR